MEYCPFCSGPLTKPARICPHCNKAIELNIYQSVFSPGESTDPNKKARRKLWFAEHARFILPGLFLVLGLIIGVVFMFGYATLHFQFKENRYEAEIAKLNQNLDQAGGQTQVVQDSLNSQIASQDSIIQILAEQKNLMRQVIAFTRRMANNSTITPGTTNEADYFRRNFRYLERQYNTQHDNLSQTEYLPENLPNLETMPALLE